MKKKGFTLVELLAVIVILAIIVLIAIPLIGNVIEKAKIGALENSVNGLVESANMYYANETIKGEIISGTTFDWVDGVQTSDKKLEYKGKVENGKLILYDAGEIAVCIDDTEHYAYKNKDTDEIISGVGTCKYDGTTGQFSSNSPTEELEKQIASTTAEAKDVLEGKTIYKTNGIVTGTMTNKSGTTTTASTVTESGDNALITIPANGYYSTGSKISVPIETIKSQLPSLTGSIDPNSVNVTSTSVAGTASYTHDQDNTILVLMSLSYKGTSNNSNASYYHTDLQINGETIETWHNCFFASGSTISKVVPLTLKKGDVVSYKLYKSSSCKACTDSTTANVSRSNTTFYIVSTKTN